ncbi:hypothetical protein [Actinomadura vinacea]|uniref:hypothetical protein n=1 Tax=Actinomadura vinacea TaxID=115336 RepID=UPI0031E4904C
MGGKRLFIVGVVVVLAVAGAVASLWSRTDLRVAPARTVKAELLTFHQGHGLPRVATVLRSGTDARAVRGWFADTGRGAPDADDVEKLAAGRDYGREVVVLFSYTSDCDSARGAHLTSDGPGSLSMRLTGVTEHEECAEPYDNLAVFAVEKARAPSGLMLGGSRTGRPDPVSPGELLAFGKLTGPPPRSTRAAEVSQPDQLEQFLRSLPAAGDELVRGDGSALQAGQGRRRFGFVLSGCREKTAILMIGEDRLAAEPVGDDATSCESAEHYVAVFAIDAPHVPPGARLG